MLLILQGTQLLAQPSEGKPKRPVMVQVEASDLDTLIFIAFKYKGLDSAYNASLAALAALQGSNSSKDNVIIIQGENLQAYVLLVENLKAQNLNQQELFFLDKALLKQKLKKRTKIILGEGFVIVILLALIVGG